MLSNQYTLVDPLLPMISTDWLIVQGDQHRRPIAATAGIYGERLLKMDWLSPIVMVVGQLIDIISEFFYLIVAIPMSVVFQWIYERFVVHKEQPEIRFPFWLAAN